MITFGDQAALALFRAGASVADKNGYISPLFVPLYAPYHLTSDEPLTAEQASAACKAQPGLCVGKYEKSTARLIDTYRWDKDRGWGYWSKDKWNHQSYSMCHPDARRVPSPSTYWRLVEDPSPQAKPILTTLTLPPDSSKPCWKDARGEVYRLNKTSDKDWACERWTGGEWMGCMGVGKLPISPCDDPSEVKIEPKCGAELRRWMVEHPGRETRSTGTDFGFRYRWSTLNVCFEQFTPLRCAWSLDYFPEAPGVPVEGTW